MQANIPKKLKEPANRKKEVPDCAVFVYRGVHVVVLPRVLLTRSSKVRRWCNGPCRNGRALPTLEPKRGDIVDRNGEVLAQSGTADTVLLYPKKIAEAGNAQTIADTLAPLLGMDAATILEKAQDTSKSEVWLKRQIDRDVADRNPCAQSNGRRLYGGYQALLSQRRFSNPGVGLCLR